MRVIHIDDERDSLEVMRLLLSRCCKEVELVASLGSVKEGIEAIKEHKPDVVFLDVEMPGKNGFDLLDELKSVPFQVIMVTGYEHYALKAIKYSALDYLLKPLDQEELKKAVVKAKNALVDSKNRLNHFRKIAEQDNEEYDSLMVSSATGFKNIKLSDFIYAESQSGSYCVIFLKDGTKEVVAKSLTYYESLLPAKIFYRIHRSHLVNIKEISKFNTSNSTVELSTGDILQVSQRKRSGLRSKVSAS